MLNRMRQISYFRYDQQLWVNCLKAICEYRVQFIHEDGFIFFCSKLFAHIATTSKNLIEFIRLILSILIDGAPGLKKMNIENCRKEYLFIEEVQITQIRNYQKQKTTLKKF